MPRIRSVHPSQWTDENFVECSFAARLFTIAVRNETDDNGIFEWKPKTLKMKLFPADNIELEPLLEELITTKQIMKFEVNGMYYGMVRNFSRYQRPEKPKFIYPTPATLSKGYCLNSKYSLNNSCDIENYSSLNQQQVIDHLPKVISEGTGTVEGIGNGKRTPTNSTDIKTPLTPQAAQNGVFKGFEGGWDVKNHLNEKGLASARSNAPEWDIYCLINVYNEGISSGKREKPRDANKAFPAWCKSYTKGVPP